VLAASGGAVGRRVRGRILMVDASY